MNASPEHQGNYVFGLDQPLDSPTFARSVRISGWLVDKVGRRIRGIRAVVQARRRGRRLTRARRKYHRHDIAAQFPLLPEAFTSGFQVEINLRLGRNSISLQVEDAERRWHTFYAATIDLLPLGFIERIGLRHVSAHLTEKLSLVRPPSTVSTIETGNGVSLADDNVAIATRQIVIYATSRSNLFIREVGQMVAAGFNELGCDAQLVFDEIPKPGRRRDLLQIVLTPHEYYNLFLLEQVSRREARRLTRDLVLLCTEQPRTGWFEQNLIWAYHARAVADISSLGVEAFRRHQIAAVHLPLGFNEILASENAAPDPCRALEILFLGSLTKRRENFFAQHSDFFSERNCHLRFVPLDFAKTEMSRSYLSVERRNALLAGSKILLNVHYSSQSYLEWHRMLLGLANQCCIITEQCAGYEPLVPNQHFVMVPRGDLIDACRYYLEFPQERKAIARAGFEFVQKHLRQSAGCRKLLHALDDEGSETPAAPLIDPMPGRLPLALAKTISAKRTFWAALRKDLRREKPSPCEAIDPDNAPPALPPEEIADARQAVMMKRAAYQKRRKEQERQMLAGDESWTIEDNAPVRNQGQPQLSILVTLFNYADYIGGCIAAVDRACAELRVPSEIVIVEDHSTDRSLARARTLARRLARPVRLIRKHLNTGLADARNIGLQVARAPYVFMMDADNLVRPRALTLLHDAIKLGSNAAAYSILCRFGETARHPLGLLSHYDWDPEILVQGPYVDAMAMFHRQTLLDLGGYDHTLSEIGWFGWEDYDMWLRFAQANLPVAFVPNILCLYRQHGASMINSTNLFTVELVKLLYQRYHSLVDKFPARERLLGIERSKLAAARSPLAPRANLTTV